MNYGIIFAAGCLAGWIASTIACVLLAPATFHGINFCRKCANPFPGWYAWVRFRPRNCAACGERDVFWPWGTAVATGILFIAFAWLLLVNRCQSIDEVQPAGSLLTGRLPFHLWLITLLVAVTITDLLDYVIPDAIVVVGAVSAVALAAWSGELQMIHIWVNWDEAIPGIQGPYLPGWMDQHRHLHGIAWSIAGLLCGSGLLWILRTSAQIILGTPAVGMGDVTMMAMVGAFIGWQPTLCVIAIAPVAGMFLGPVIRACTGRSFVAFGPYLAASTIVVLSTWRLLWVDCSLRTIFSHWPSVAGLVVASLVVLQLLLLALRGFRSLPTSVMRR